VRSLCPGYCPFLVPQLRDRRAAIYALFSGFCFAYRTTQCTFEECVELLVPCCHVGATGPKPPFFTATALEVMLRVTAQGKTNCYTATFRCAC
jgi:hypothetical protein